MSHFGIFNELLSTQNVNIARFARNVECDFFCDFQTPCVLQLQIAFCTNRLFSFVAQYLQEGQREGN